MIQTDDQMLLAQQCTANLRSILLEARKVLSEKRPLKKVRDNNTKVEAARGKPEIFANFRKENARKFRGFLAPEYNIQCIEAAVNQPFDEGMKTERKLFGELMSYDGGLEAIWRAVGEVLQ